MQYSYEYWFLKAECFDLKNFSLIQSYIVYNKVDKSNEEYVVSKKY
jgi:hypothetical protein